MVVEHLKAVDENDVIATASSGLPSMKTSRVQAHLIMRDPSWSKLKNTPITHSITTQTHDRKLPVSSIVRNPVVRLSDLLLQCLIQPEPKCERIMSSAHRAAKPSSDSKNGISASSNGREPPKGYSSRSRGAEAARPVESTRRTVRTIAGENAANHAAKEPNPKGIGPLGALLDLGIFVIFGKPYKNPRVSREIGLFHPAFFTRSRVAFSPALVLTVARS